MYLLTQFYALNKAKAQWNQKNTTILSMIFGINLEFTKLTLLSLEKKMPFL